MVFSSRIFPEEPGEILFEDRFRQVEMGVAFRCLTCYHCGLTTIYKYRIQQLRRRAEIDCTGDEEVRPEHTALWNSMPRYAEIPQTLKCKRCGEVLGVYTSCVF